MRSGACDFQVALGRLRLRGRDLVVGLSGVEIGSRHQLLIEQRFCTDERAVGVSGLRLRRLDRALRREEVGVALIDRGLEQQRVEPGDDVALLHLRVEVGQDLLDAPRHLTANLDTHNRRYRSAGRDLRDDRASIDRDRLIAHHRRRLGRDATPNDQRPRYQSHHERDPHDSPNTPRHSRRLLSYK